MAKTSYTRAISKGQAGELRKLLTARSFEFSDKPYAIFSAAGEKVNVTVYEKGPKVLVQGKGTEDFVQFHLEPEVLGVAEMGYEEVLDPEMFAPHIGVDESGKGDFFGPLVIAGTYVNEGAARALIDAGVTDSKRIGSDARIRALAAEVRKAPGAVSEVIKIGPSKYNELYGEFRNLNRLLAWGHAKVIAQLKARVPSCPRALSDQFANPRELERALTKQGVEDLVLQQRTKAESDVAVAAASILAREAFIDWLDENSKRAGIELPKGCSPAVKEAGKALLAKGGAGALPAYAKMHFKTADEVLGSKYP